ncbi:dynein intermediate chain 2, ciliary-like [Cimex lectularius]|uniref:Dynein intermediate chain 2, ciliary n=1 Tax=Cimex lectularius TaxID=79782 RepID=A0A8I6REV4_CIMLE|nr:dynein intermediate chain 2, ciliary-like [Cimex lectularius]
MSKYPASHPLWVVNPEFDKLYVTTEKFDITRAPSVESVDSYTYLRQEIKANKQLEEQEKSKDDSFIKRQRFQERLVKKKKKSKKDKKAQEKEEIDLTMIYQRELTPTDPLHVIHHVMYEYSSGEFVPTDTKATEVFLYEIEGNVVVHDSPEAIMQRRRLEPEKFIVEPEDEDDNLSILKFLPPSQDNTKLEEELAEEEEIIEEEEMREEEVEEEEKDTFDYEEFDTGDKKLPNQFNFNERAVLTTPIITRNKTTQTKAPTRISMKGIVTQWNMTDYYGYDYDLQQQVKEKAKKLKALVLKKKEKKELKVVLTPAESIFVRLLKGTQLMERMVNQYMYEEFALDCHFYDDPADTYRILEGAVLPLWEFSYEESVGLTVTYISWHPKYQDMFCVAYGSFKFCAKYETGMICVYSLKNPAFPESVIRVRSGAMCVNFNKSKPNYMAVGLYDGTVSVHNLIEEETVFSSTLENKHVGPVWEVQWSSDPRDGKLSFLSVALDGKVTKWIIVETCLLHFNITTLYLDNDHLDDIMGVKLTLPATAQCLTLHPENYEAFLVGSAEGDIFQCNVSYATTPTFKYLGHDMAVNCVTFNTYITDIFMSCSDDWTIKIWESNRSKPLLVYDLECAVGDVTWSPYSSSIFAAITSDGNIQIFDMNINKFDAVCVQTIFLFDHSSPTRLQFNQKLAIILVGDTK